MNEKFLQFIWQEKLYKYDNLQTTSGDKVEIIESGSLNKNEGPDFFASKISIGRIVFYGTIELHLKTSDWYRHGHDDNKLYKTVILHIVWKNDKKENSIPTLELSNYVDSKNLEKIRKMYENMNNKKGMICKDILKDKDFKYFESLYEYFYVKRIKKKTEKIKELLLKNNNDWEGVFFIMLCSYFGVNVNKTSFHNLAMSMDFRIFIREMNDLKKLESLMFGQAGMLEEIIEDEYYNELKENYSFIKEKYKLSSLNQEQFKFSRLRPYSFPTIRIAQLCSLYFNKKLLFSKISSFKTIKDIKDLLHGGTSKYWETHYLFDKESKEEHKNISNSFKELLIINVVVPLLYVYSKMKMDETLEKKVLALMDNMQSEKNEIVSSYSQNGFLLKTAKHSQAILEIKENICDKQKCIGCLILKS